MDQSYNPKKCTKSYQICSICSGFGCKRNTRKTHGMVFGMWNSLCLMLALACFGSQHYASVLTMPTYSIVWYCTIAIMPLQLAGQIKNPIKIAVFSHGPACSSQGPTMENGEAWITAEADALFVRKRGSTAGCTLPERCPAIPSAAGVPRRAEGKGLSDRIASATQALHDGRHLARAQSSCGIGIAR